MECTTDLRVFPEHCKKKILERYGVSFRLGPASIEEAQAEAATLEEWLSANPD